MFYEHPEDLSRIVRVKEIQIEEEPQLNENDTPLNEDNDDRSGAATRAHKYLSDNLLYPPMKFQINSGLIWMFKFVLARHVCKSFKYNKFTLEYFNKITLVKTNFEEAKKSRFFKKLAELRKKKRIKTLFNFSYFFRAKLYNFYADIFKFLKEIRFQNREFYSYLLLNFKNNKINATVQSFKKLTLMNIVAGLFLKFFNNQKSKKKNKIMKTLIAKYLRKIFILAKLQYFNVIIRHNPVDLVSFFTSMNAPIIAPFKDPYDETLIEETNLTKFLIKFNYFVFKDCAPYHKRKTKKKGRIKRKILRKLVIENKLVD